jgi:LysM repeat protein
VIVFCWMATRTAPGRIGGGPLATTAAPGGGNPAAVQVWTVRPGDTLWSIAEAVDPNGDVRPLVDSLAAEVGSTAIYPGEAIAIPGR